MARLNWGEEKREMLGDYVLEYTTQKMTLAFSPIQKYSIITALNQVLIDIFCE